MTKAPIGLQDLRRSLYIKAKAEPACRFWGLYVHVCKRETLREAYQMAKKNDGAPGIDGVTFEAIEESGVASFLQQIQDELVSNRYRPMAVRKKEIPKDGGNKVRILSIPAIRDRRKRYTELPKRLTRAKPESSIWISGPTWIHIHNAPSLFEKTRGRGYDSDAQTFALSLAHM